MINVGRIINSRNFAQTYTVYRQTGQWVSGRWVEDEETPIKIHGTVTALNPNDLVQVPEGDRVVGMMNFYAQQQLYTTRAEGADPGDPGGTSDQIDWHGERYRISSVVPWGDFGFYKAVGVRMVSE